MSSFTKKLSLPLLLATLILAILVGCGTRPGSQTSNNVNSPMQPSESKEVKVDPFNESGLAIIRVREGEVYQEGVVDSKDNEILQLSANYLVKDLTGSLALINCGRKFLFVPLDQGSITAEDIESVNGFQYAQPFHCGLALVCVNDSWFYLDTEFKKVFGSEFQFAESFHHDRALVKENDRYRIINTDGETVAELNYDQVNSQSPKCWQVINIEHGMYRSGFVGLNGEMLTELMYEGPVFYQPEVQRIRVTVGKLHGFLDDDAKTAIPVKYEHAEIFDRGIARVMLDGRTFFIDPDGNEVSE